MSQHTRKLLSARPGLVNEMPDVYTAGPQMFNELFNFPPGLELLGVPPSKADGVPGSKLNSYNNWRVLNGQQEQQYDYAGSFNSQKEANMNPQSLDAMQLYVLNSANRGNFSAPTITNGGIDHHQSSSHGNSIQFQLPAFPQSIANQGLCNIEQVPSRDSWQSGGGVNELLLLPTGNGDNLLNNNIQFIPPHQLNHTDWENGSLQASTSQWCEQSSLETKFGTRDDRSVQGLSLSLASNPQVQETHARLISTQDMANRLQATAHPKDNSVDVLNGYKVGVLFPFSRSEGILSAKGYWNPNTALSGQFTGYVKQSKYMKPTRQLLDEFCNVAGKEVKENFQNSVCAPQQSHQKSQPESTFGDCNINQFINQSGLKIETSVSVGGKATAVMCNERLNGNGYKDGVDYSKERFELRRRKAKLVWMLDEVERRYRQYCEQMKIVGTSFDSAAGVGAATTYTCLAAKAMSRHFKCLKDAITGQIKETNDALGEKESNVPGITKGETPRLKLIEQSLRQRRTFQQVGMLEHDAWRPQRGLPERAVTVLRAWLFEHFLHPYPSDADKHLLARQTGLSRSQVSNWFINARVRLWKPMVEEMYQEEARNAEMEEADTNSNHNKHEKNEVGATHSNRSVKGDVYREEEAAALVERKNAIEDNAKKVHVGDLEMSTYNGNGNMLHQQNISSTYYGSGDVTLTLGLRHNAHQEKYPNALCLPC